MNIRKTLIAATAASIALLAGCSTAPHADPAYASSRTQEPTYEQVSSSKFVASSHEAITKLLASPSIQSYKGEAPVLVATVVNVNNMGVTAPLGRTLSEQYANAMTNSGFNVKEMKLRDNVFIREETGELMLSREIKEIAKSHNAELVLVGTYSPAESMTFVSLKAVRTADNRIISGHDYALPNDKDVKHLLRTPR